MADTGSLENSVLALLASDHDGVKQKIAEYVAAQSAAQAKIAEASVAVKAAQAAQLKADQAQAKADADAEKNTALAKSLGALQDEAVSAKAEAQKARAEFQSLKTAYDAKAAELAEKNNAVDKLRADLNIELGDAKTLQIKLTKARDVCMGALREVGL